MSKKKPAANIRLGELISKLQLTNEEFGNKLDPTVSKQSVGKWVRGICPPTKLSWRLQIKKMSEILPGGPIEPTDWPD